MITTLTTTAAEDARIAVAFGHKLNLPGNATAAQVKADIAAYVANVVSAYEAGASSSAAVAAIVPPAPVAPT